MFFFKYFGLSRQMYGALRGNGDNFSDALSIFYYILHVTNWIIDILLMSFLLTAIEIILCM